MKKTLTLLAAAFSAVTLMSCATTLSIERTIPSELDMTGTKTVAILPMGLDSSSKFIDDQRKLSSKFISELKNYATQDTKFTLVDDTTIQTALNNGFAVPADVLIKPKFTKFSVTDSGATITSKNDDGTEVVVRDAWKRIISGDLDVTITKSSTKTVIGTKHFDWFDGNTEDKPKASLTNPVTYLNDKMSSYAYLTATQVFDTKSLHAIQLKDSKDKTLKDKMKQGSDLAKAKEYEASQKVFASIYASTNDSAAGYNSARMLQVMGKFNESLEILRALYDADPDKSILRAIEDVKEEKAKQDVLDKRNSN